MGRLDSQLALLLLICIILLTSPFSALAQVDAPLLMQGVDHETGASAASRGAGGLTFAIRNDAGLMFTSPASLESLTSFQIVAGGFWTSQKFSQTQQYTPLKYYPNFSLLMEGLTDRIGNPDPNKPGVRLTDAGDTVQRPFDNLLPNWGLTRHRTLPLELMAAVPFMLGETKLVAAAGMTEYADLDHYYLNNNILTPDIGSERPVPVNLPLTDSLPVVTQWQQFVRIREGSIRAYGGALAAKLSDKITLGASGMLLKGTSDDVASRTDRGRLTFYRNYFRAEPLTGGSLSTGTSDYSGWELTLSGLYTGKYLTLGFAARPPTTITRTFRGTVGVTLPLDVRSSQDNRAYIATAVEQKDKIKLPWRGTVGLSLAVLQSLHLGVEYEYRPYGSAEYLDPNGTVSNPWLSASVLHIGAELQALPWLTLRAGMRDRGEVFEPEGNPLPGETVGGMIYTGGVGATFGPLRLNVAYEYNTLRYQDMWLTNVNLQSSSSHTIVADVAYEIPFTN
ncbi:MAG TPA: hypothetical protein VF889_02590 [Bacteroidota bacterium]